jgi:hypothetical protein
LTTHELLYQRRRNRYERKVKEPGVPLELQQNEESSLLCLEGLIDIACAAELKKLLIEALSGAKEVRRSIIVGGGARGEGVRA